MENKGHDIRWHALPAEEVSRLLASDPENGLSAGEAGMRLERFGPNTLREAKGKGLLRRFFGQFNDFIIWVLIAAAFIAGILLKEYLDAVVIAAIVLMNAVLGFVQESRSEGAINELKELSAPTAKVIRDGGEAIVPALELVPGDLIVLEAGDLAGADARLLTSANLRVNESNLTGESAAVEKDARAVVEPDAAVGDRSGMVFAGTHVEYGRCTAVVVETAYGTQLGGIASMLEEGGSEITPLQVELGSVGRKIVYICIAVALVVFTVGMLRGSELAVMLLFAVSLAVAAIPEGLPAIVTITLSFGTQAMAKQNAIVRNLAAVETLGCADYICSDKTGTLTLNRMTVMELLLGDGSRHALAETVTEGPGFPAEALGRMLTSASLCSDARKAAGGGFIGEATEVSILEAAASRGIDKAALEKEYPRVAEVPFDSDRKMMTTANMQADGFAVHTKGAVEELLSRSGSVLTPEGTVPLDYQARQMLLERTVVLGSQGLRTLSVAYRLTDELPSPADAGSLENGLVFLGAFALKDPPRPEAFGALETCRRAHIEVAMITGDHRSTAEAIARELEILEPGELVMEGHMLEELSAEELASQVEDISVYARVSPRHKVKIVEALQSLGHVVAMTGDGVNDAPALKRADIGVAMAITGTDVAKEASDMVLADDNFATIVAAVRQGRIIFSNLQKFIYFLLSTNISIILTLFIAMLSGLPLPLLPSQVLWINLVTNGLPALALGLEVPEKGIMEQRPRSGGESILSLPRQFRLLWEGAVLSAGALASLFLAHFWLGYSWSSESGLAASRTILFTTMVLAYLLHAYNWRSGTRSFLTAWPWENRWLLGAFLLSAGLQMSVLYVPFMQKAFHTTAPSGSEWALILACSILPVLVIDRIKMIGVRSNRGQV